MMTNAPKKPLLVTESAFDHRLLAALLIARGVRGFSIVAGSGADGAVRLAQGLRIERKIPVLVVVDADTTDEEAAHAKSEDLTDFLRLGGEADPAWVVCAVPAVESVLFRHPGWLRERFANLDAALIRIGLRAPTAVLEEIAGRGWREQIQALLDESPTAALRDVASDPVVDDIASFVRDPHRFAPERLAAPRLGFGT